jgi:hypothetical protein
LLKISVHVSGVGIAHTLYFPAASGCPATSTSLLTVSVVASSAPGHQTLPHATTPPNSVRPRALGRL